MADIPANVAEQMMTDIAANATLANTQARNGFTVVTGVLQGSIVRRFDETGVAEGKTKSAIIATDAGGPTNKAGA
tara:strand:- start:1844 stop:2068 length:225 start_codon:yes stop_codon:yes gene_type:complete